MAPDDWLRLRVDGLVKLPSRQGVIGNRFTASDGSEKRQLLVEGSTITCALCEETTWDLSGDVHRNWHAAQHSIKSHCGHFASCRRGNAHVELLEKASGQEISMEGAPVKTSSGPFAASVFLRPVAAPIDGVDGVASPSPQTRRHRRDAVAAATRASPHRRQCQKAGEARARRVPDATDDRAQEPPGLGAAGLAPQTEHGLASAPPGLRRDEEVPAR